jgi:glycosyltransferase involved in cell wall biosynthesis
LIPLGVDVNHFNFQFKEISHPIQFLHIGNFNKVKDQVTLIKAFKLIHDKVPSQLTIIGEGREEEKIKPILNELSLQGDVSIQREMPNSSLREYYHSAHILLHTSLSEGHPIVVEESMSCGVLVCGTQVGLLYDLPECCVSVPIGDFESLASNVLDLLNDQNRRANILRNASEWSANHSMDWTVQQFSNLYESP